MSYGEEKYFIVVYCVSGKKKNFVAVRYVLINPKFYFTTFLRIGNPYLLLFKHFGVELPARQSSQIKRSKIKYLIVFTCQKILFTPFTPYLRHAIESGGNDINKFVMRRDTSATASQIKVGALPLLATIIQK